MFLYQAAKHLTFWTNIDKKLMTKYLKIVKMIRIAIVGEIASGKTFIKMF